MLDYSISHKILLLRNNDSYESQGPNTDLTFESVYFMDMPTSMEDIVLYEGDDEVFKQIEAKCVREIFRQYETVFVLESQGKKYYVGCWRYQIKQNNLNPLTSGLYKPD